MTKQSELQERLNWILKSLLHDYNDCLYTLKILDQNNSANKIYEHYKAFILCLTSLLKTTKR